MSLGADSRAAMGSGPRRGMIAARIGWPCRRMLVAALVALAFLAGVGAAAFAAGVHGLRAAEEAFYKAVLAFEVEWHPTPTCVPPWAPPATPRSYGARATTRHVERSRRGDGSAAEPETVGRKGRRPPSDPHVDASAAEDRERPVNRSEEVRFRVELMMFEAWIGTRCFQRRELALPRRPDDDLRASI
jgi:hypothetical protein